MARPPSPRRAPAVYAFFLLFFLLNALLWVWARPLRAAWNNVPPPPAPHAAVVTGMGDTQFAYRVLALTLQNMGDTGGDTANLADYRYDRVAGWLRMLSALDPVSNFPPFLAAYFYAGTRDDTDLGPIVSYLAEVGMQPQPEKWRWLAQAIYLARFRLNDQPRAYQLALKLAAIRQPNMPGWVRQMPAFVMLSQGDREAAYNLMLETLKTEGEKMDPSEVRFMVYYICERILTKEQAQADPVCTLPH